MKVVNKRQEKEKVQFKDLPIGQTYIDTDGMLSIKTSFNEEYNCITLYDEDWSVWTECITEKVTPIEATLTIE